MSNATVLLELQDIDLARARDRAELAAMPELKDLARKRAAYLALKRRATELMAERKDVETDIADADAARAAAERGVEAAQARTLDRSDYRQVQDLEVELSGYAKELDKAAFARRDAEGRLESARRAEEELACRIERAERVIVADTKAARVRASEVQGRLDAAARRRDALAAELPADLLADYEAALERFGGLAVERLEGAVPSICRTALAPAALDELSRGDEIARCPYCHRILVRAGEGA